MVLLVLPMLKTAGDYSRLRLRRAACASVLEASLPAAYRAVSADALSLGRLELDENQARMRIEQLLRQNMTRAKLDARLQLLRIEFARMDRPEDRNHWLSGNRPSAMPVVSASAEWVFPDGWLCRIDDRIELVLD